VWFVVTHPSRKNKSAARVGHPALWDCSVVGQFEHFSAACLAPEGCFFKLTHYRTVPLPAGAAQTVYNGFMYRRSLIRFIVSVAVFALALCTFATSAQAQQNAARRGRKYKAPPPTARIEVTVVRDFDGKPIENAAIIFHAMEGEKDTGVMEQKSNEDGKTIIEVLPIGDTIRLQIIAKGFQTYGGDYKIDKAELAIAIRLNRPGEQYSLYKPHPETSENGTNPNEAKPANPPAGTAPAPASKDKPADQPPSDSSQAQPPPK